MVIFSKSRFHCLLRLKTRKTPTLQAVHVEIQGANYGVLFGLKYFREAAVLSKRPFLQVN